MPLVVGMVGPRAQLVLLFLVPVLVLSPAGASHRIGPPLFSVSYSSTRRGQTHYQTEENEREGGKLPEPSRSAVQTASASARPAAILLSRICQEPCRLMCLNLPDGKQFLTRLQEGRKAFDLLLDGSNMCGSGVLVIKLCLSASRPLCLSASLCRSVSLSLSRA